MVIYASRQYALSEKVTPRCPVSEDAEDAFRTDDLPKEYRLSFYGTQTIFI